MNNQLIERFAEIQGISYEEAEKQIGTGTDEEILENIQKFTAAVINQNSTVKLNRAQRRALAKKAGKKNLSNAELISETAQKLNYIDLIQKLRELNKKKETENNDTANEDN